VVFWHQLVLLIFSGIFEEHTACIFPSFMKMKMTFLFWKHLQEYIS